MEDLQQGEENLMDAHVWSLLHEPLTAREEEAVAQRRRGATQAAIGATLGVRPSRAAQILESAARKIERERALMAVDDPLDCSIELLPIPPQRRGALSRAGCKTLRELVHLPDAQLLRVQGCGSSTLELVRAYRRQLIRTG
ncbi:MAG: hypothetical protein ABI779_24470 [Acidobacteriota bacterium]